MPSYISKPMPVEAMQWTGMNWAELREWFERLEAPALLSTTGVGDSSLKLQTDLMDAEIGVTDWIICNGNGVVFLANDEAFQERYALAEEVLGPNGGTIENPLGD